MKNLTKFFALAVVILGFSANSFAQTQTATATVVVTPATMIIKGTNMDFGSIAQSSNIGTVVLDPVNGETESLDGITVTGASTAATFNLTGGADHDFNFTIPTGVITASNGGASMTIDTWTSVPGSAAGLGTGTLSGTSGVIKVGATLHVGVAQLAGTYTTPTFEVTVSWP